MSSARIIKKIDDSNRLEFTLSGLDVAYANGLRRTIISDITCLVFRTTPHEHNKCNITTNTTRLNNEIIKQRLSCVPICVNSGEDIVTFLDNYMLEVDVENKTDEVLIVTTKDFKIKHIKTDEYLSEDKLRQIFPPYIDPFHAGEHYIQIVRLRPKISDEIAGEKLSLTCRFDVGTAKEDGMFNVAGTCSYRQTPDVRGIADELIKKVAVWKDEGMSDAEVEFEKKNWQLLDGLRITLPNSFDFVLETVGIYANEQLVKKACTAITSGLNDVIEKLKNDEFEITQLNNTMPNYYGISLKNYDYTIGNILNHEMFELFFNSSNPQIHFVSTKKLHPHNDFITMEVSVINSDNSKDKLVAMLIQSCHSAKENIKLIKKQFKRE